jgi:hypothetical protein
MTPLMKLKHHKSLAVVFINHHLKGYACQRTVIILKMQWIPIRRRSSWNLASINKNTKTIRAPLKRADFFFF